MTFLLSGQKQDSVMFLFGSDIAAYIAEIYDKAADIHGETGCRREDPGAMDPTP